MKIHPSAVISPEAKLAEGVEVGPFSVIGPSVTIGKGTVIGSHVVIQSHTDIGENNRIFQFASIGAPPQDLKYRGRRRASSSATTTPSGSTSRSTAPTTADIGVTKIGNHNLIMAYCHVAHNCLLENNIVMANAANLAGHIHVENFAIIGDCRASTSSPGSAPTASSAAPRR